MTPFFDDSPETDEMLRQALTKMSRAQRAQAEIIPFIGEAARVLAKAAKLSSAAVGDSPQYAISRWIRVMEDEAKRLLREDLADVAPEGVGRVEPPKRQIEHKR